MTLTISKGQRLLLLIFLCFHLKIIFSEQIKVGQKLIKHNTHRQSNGVKLSPKLEQFPEKKLSKRGKPLKKRCQCGRAEIDRMKPMELINSEDQKPIKLLRQKKRLGKGSYSEVLHVQVKTIGDKIYNKCAALKMTVKDLTDSDWQKLVKEWKIQKSFDTLEEAKRTHIVKLIAYGYHKMGKKQYVFSLLELGTGDLIKQMRQKRIEWQRNKVNAGDRHLEPNIRQLAETARQLHQKVIHLDLKPQNVVFVKEGQNSVMKAIDFGSSQFIDEDGEFGNTTEKANACKWIVINDPITTKLYQSPEHHDQCNWAYETDKEHAMELTAKSDIWAIGITIYEMAFFGLEFKLMNQNIPQKYVFEESNRQSFIRWLWLLYTQKDDAILKEDIWLWVLYTQKNDKKLTEEMRQEHWDDFYRLFFTILCIRLQFPRTFHLITAILVYDPMKRPTANGILSFLDDKCYFESMHSGTSRLFPWLSMAKFKEHLEEQCQLFRGELETLEDQRQREAMERKVDEAERLLWMASLMKEWEPSEKHRKVPCDTGTTKTMPKRMRTSPRGVPTPPTPKGMRMTPTPRGMRTTPRGVPTTSTKAQNGTATKAMGEEGANFNKMLTKLMKSIGLTLSPRIQNGEEAIELKFGGTFENLQDSFYNRSSKPPFDKSDDRFVRLLSKIGYTKLRRQLSFLIERYENDAKKLKKVVDSAGGMLDTEWEKIEQLAAEYEKEADTEEEKGEKEETEDEEEMQEERTESEGEEPNEVKKDDQQKIEGQGSEEEKKTETEAEEEQKVMAKEREEEETKEEEEEQESEKEGEEEEEEEEEWSEKDESEEEEAEEEVENEFGWYRTTIDQIKAVYLYELIYKHFISELEKNATDLSFVGSPRASFLYEWLLANLNNLKEFHAQKEHKILQTLQLKRKHLEKKLDKIQKLRDEMIRKMLYEFGDYLCDLESIDERHANKENDAANANFSKSDKNGLTAKMPNGKKPNEAMAKKKILVEKYKEETKRIQSEFEKKKSITENGMEICKMMEQKIEEFAKTI